MAKKKRKGTVETDSVSVCVHYTRLLPPPPAPPPAAINAVWKVYLDPKWARQRLRLYGAQDRALEQFFKQLEKEMGELFMKRHERAKQLVVFVGVAGIGTGEGWVGDVVLRACCKVVRRPRGIDQRRGRVVLVNEHRTTRPTKGKGKAKGKAAKAKPAPQPGRWLDGDCNAALNMQRIGESRWRPLELCYWPEQGKLPAKGKEYPGLGYKRLRGKPPKAQEQQPAVAHPLVLWREETLPFIRAHPKLRELWEEYKEQLEGRVLYRPGKEARVGVVIHCQYHDYVSQYAPFYMVRWDGEQVTCAEPLDEVLRCLTDTFAPERWVPIDLRLAQANGWHRPQQEQMAMLCALVKRQAEDAGSRPGPPTASDASSDTAIAPAAVPGRSWEAGSRPEALAGRKISYCDRAVFVQTGAAANGQGLFTKMQAALLEQQTAPKQISTLPLPLTNRARQPPLTATTSSNAATESTTTTTTITTKQASASTVAQAGQQGKAKRPRPQAQAVPQGVTVASDTATQPAASKQSGDKAGAPRSSTGQKGKASAGSALPSASKRKPDRSASAAEDPASKQASKKGPAAAAARHTPKATPPATPVPPSPHGSLAAAAVLAGLRHGSDGLASPASPSALSSGGGKSPVAKSASASGRKKGSGSGKAGRRVSVGRGGSMQQELGEGEMRGVTGRVYPANLCCCPGDKEDDGTEDGDFEVDWIVDEAGKGKETMYLIKWKGYKLRPGSPGSKGDWEPLANVRDTPAWDAWVKHPKPSYF
ncbi:hypothetical protein QJQ45_002146 [Haematococcus lacustris]|nr:hypothetical protein QJQ45_002146 [Haematococcus lacustris]